MFRIEPDCLAVVGNRTIEFARVEPHLAAVVVGLGIFRIEPDRLGQIGHGAVEIADVLI
jgi:hypothetical protein